MIKRIYLEITDACNLNCPFCTNEKGHAFMDFELVKSAVLQCKDICEYIYLHVLGEPLLHQDFDAILDLLDDNNMKLQLVTNGVLLNRHPDLLKHKCLRKLSISLHSVSNLNIMPSYFKQIDRLLESNSQTIIELRFFEEQYLSKDLLSYRQSLIDRYGIKPTRMKNCLKLKDNAYLATAEFFKWPDINDPYISNVGYCHGGKDMIAILHNGDVTLCCLDPKGHNAFGNIKEEALRDILKSSQYQDYLKDLSNRKMNRELCSKCSYRLRFDGRNS